MPRKVVASLYVTLDGFIDEPGLWSFPFWSQEAADFKARELAASDAPLLGRLTYEGFAAYWPMSEGTGDFGAKMNAMPKHVASRTLRTAPWNATLMEGDVADAVRRLKALDGGDLLIAGSGQLVDYLTGHDNDRRMPPDGRAHRARGRTKRLFARAPRRTLALAGTLALPNGVLVNTYRRAVSAP
jgi:dihydrofolate reductase